ncbi:hypothetical protein M9458_044698, partial [Cirrhinus mrigala]
PDKVRMEPVLYIKGGVNQLQVRVIKTPVMRNEWAVLRVAWQVKVAVVNA